MADKKKMSVEEILAACRGGSGEAAAPAESAAAQEPAAESPPAKPAVAKLAAAKKPAAMNTADILAAARGGKPATEAGEAAPAAAKPASAKPAVKPGSASTADILAMARGAKPAAAAAPTAEAPKKAPAVAVATATAKPAPAKESPKPAAAEKSAGTIDTASILAAARGGPKPGPISKAELAAREQTSPVDKTKKKAEVAPMPEKPAYAQSRAAAATQPDRRGFIQGTLAAISGSAMALGFSSLAVTFNLWGLGLARFMFPNILTEPPTKFKVGFPNELGQGQVQTKFVPQFGVWIVRHEYDGAPQIFAIQTVCTHLGCTPNWLEGEQKFKCPCHGSGFYKDGINFEGPAPRPLERFAIRLADDGQLEVDKSRKFKEELGQWRDTACGSPTQRATYPG